MRIVLCIFVALVAAFYTTVAPAWPRRHCNRTYQTITSYNGWSNNCSTSGCHAANYVHKPAVAPGVSSILGGLAQKQGEWSTLLQGLDQLGFRPSGQGGTASGGYSQTSGHYTNQQAALGNYGQSVYFRQASDANPLATLAMAERLATQTGQIAGQGYTQAAGLMGQNLQIAEIQAVRDTAVAVLQASRPPKAASSQTFTFQTSVDSNGQVSVTPQQPQQGGGYQQFGGQQQGPNDYGLGAVLQNRCISCHAGAEAKGGLDLTKLGSMSPQEQADVLWKSYQRVTSPDLKLRMPLNAEALPPEESVVFAFASGALGGQQGSAAPTAPTQ